MRRIGLCLALSLSCGRAWAEEKKAAGAGSGGGSGTGSAAADDEGSPKRPVREPKPAVVTASSYGPAYVFTERFDARGDMPATAALHVRANAVTAYVGKRLTDASYRARDATDEVKGDGLAYGLTPVFRVVNGLRLGAGFDSEDGTTTHRVGTGTGPKRQRKDGHQLLTFHAQGAYRIQGPYAVGLKYSTSRLRIYSDARLLGGAVTNNGEAFSDIRPSAALLKAVYELHLEFQPKIDLAAGPAALSRPATTLLQYRRTLAPGRVAMLDFEYGMFGALGEGLANAPTLRGGFVTSQPSWGDVGGTLGYRHTRHAQSRHASPETIATIEGSLYGDYRPDRETHYLVGVGGELGEGMGESAGGARAKLKTQTLRYQVAFGRVL